MNFCPDCENYLALKISNIDTISDISDLLSLKCNNCHYEKKIDIKKEPEYMCVHSNNYNNTNDKLYNKNLNHLSNDPTLPVISNIQCPNSNCPTITSKNIENNITYIELDKSTLTFIYQCKNCNHTWTNK